MGRTTWFWILDYGATNHLTRSFEHFVSYILCASNETIRIADGSLASIAEKGKISPYADISLHNVLHVCTPYFIIIIII